eukprot:jgi/Hompol1/6650/HPOL_005042-RA
MLPPIPGERVTNRDHLHYLRETVAELMGSKLFKFPGAQPVSFSASHIQELCNEDYFVSEKADGVRVMMFTTRLKNGEGETFLIDRKNDFYMLNFGLVKKGGREVHAETVLDGELVYETERDKVQRHETGQEHDVLLLMLFDAMVIDGENICGKTYMKRLGVSLGGGDVVIRLRQYILEPHMDLIHRNPSAAHQYPFRITQKRLELSYKLHKVYSQIQAARHKTDGLIFTSAVAPYTLGTCQKMLKWKPSEENTVDFKILEAVQTDRGVLYRIGILERGNEHIDCGLMIPEGELATIPTREALGRIIECRYSPTGNSQWRFSRMRDDKDSANHISTYEKILESIRDNISQEQLMGASEMIEAAWQRRSR